MEKKLNIAIALLGGVLLCTFFMVVSANVTVTPDAVGFGIGGKQYVWLGQNVDGVYVGDIKFGEGLPANSGTDIGDVTVNNTEDITVSLDSEVVDVDATGQGDVPITLDSEKVVIDSTNDVTVSLDSEVVSVDATGQGDVPISTSRDLTVTLDSETVTVDSELAAAAAAADDAANPTVPQVGAMSSLYNSTAVDASWDRERNNWSIWPFPSAQYQYTAPVTGQTVELTNYNARGAYIVVNITGIGLNQTLTVNADIFDYDGAGAEASDQTDTIWASAALTPTGRHTYLIYPGAGAAAQDVDATVSYPLPRLWNIGVTVSNNEPITFSIGVHYIN